MLAIELQTRGRGDAGPRFPSFKSLAYSDGERLAERSNDLTVGSIMRALVDRATFAAKAKRRTTQLQLDLKQVKRHNSLTQLQLAKVLVIHHSIQMQ